ncbi:MAG: peptidylprolyl isomerase [Acidimicrobiia bacterium]|jgi:FKBP-type peptidyl-prolyl cis-trans isomerase 2|nr:peptidylprolyl isomerase [Acidimicrobiia bacterium]
MPVSGDRVMVHYTGTLDDGSEFDSSQGRDPLEFEVGAAQVIPGFEKAVEVLSVGESTTFRLEPGDAYGEARDDLVFEVPQANAPDGLTVGDSVQLATGQPATVLAVSEQTVKIDANHPLAGQALTFSVELMSVVSEGQR